MGHSFRTSHSDESQSKNFSKEPEGTEETGQKI